MLPLLIQFHSSQPQEAIGKKPGKENVLQIMLESKYIPEGLVDAALYNGIAIWKTDQSLCILISDDTYTYSYKNGIQSAVSIQVNNSIVSVNKQELKPDKLTVTESDLEKMVKRNEKMFAQLAKETDIIKPYIEKLMMVACQTGSISSFDIMVETTTAAPDMDAAGTTLMFAAKTTLMVAAGHGQKGLVEHLSRKYEMDVNHIDSDGYCALSMAIACNHLDLVKCIVELGGGPNGVVKVPNVAQVKVSLLGVVKMGNGDRDSWEDMTDFLQLAGIKWRYGVLSY